MGYDYSTPMISFENWDYQIVVIKNIVDVIVPKIAKNLGKCTFPFSAVLGLRKKAKTPFTIIGIIANVNARIINSTITPPLQNKIYYKYYITFKISKSSILPID